MSAAPNLDTRIETSKSTAVAAPGCPARMAAEVASLPASARLARSGDLVACIAESGEIPGVLQEIGRLRESTFRTVGEGTGRAVDLDAFDRHYRHLFVWDAERSRVVGAYRCVETDGVRRRFGTSGLYSSTLFDYTEAFFERMGPAIELGRSFVRPEYQRVSRALFLLWRAIGTLVSRQPSTPVLFGPVSISASYSERSRELMVEYLSTYQSRADLRSELVARMPVYPGSEARSMAAGGRNHFDRLEWLSAQIERIEGKGMGVPLLLAEYMKLGGSFAGFNRDPSFSDVIDGLVVVDLRSADPRLLSMYMGKESTRAFLEGSARARPGR